MKLIYNLFILYIKIILHFLIKKILNFLNIHIFKKYRKLCSTKSKNEISKINIEEVNETNSKIRIISQIILLLSNKSKSNNEIINLLFDYLSIQENNILDNIPIIRITNNG